jgi:GntR family transcriptional regulator, rspAB operon transcriptional repressor
MWSLSCRLPPSDRRPRVSVLEPISTKKTTLTDRVYDALRDAVVSRALPPGERVTEAGLAEQLSVSKTPVREALQRLEYVGLIESDDGRACVVVPSAEAIREAYELRTALETEAVRLATARADLVTLETIMDRARESLDAAQRNDLATFKTLDREFHTEIASASQNRRLQLAIRDVLDLSSALRNRDAPNADASPHCAQQHVAVASAMAARNELDAEDQLRKHLDSVRDLVLSSFSQAT